MCCWGWQDQGECGHVPLLLGAAPGHIRPQAQEVGLGAGGLCWQSRLPLVSLHVPAATSVAHEQRQEGSCAGAIPREKEDGNGLAPAKHHSLEMPLSADTHLCPHTLGTSLRAALAPHAHSCASFPSKTTSELTLATPVRAGTPKNRGGPQEDSPGTNWT